MIAMPDHTSSTLILNFNANICVCFGCRDVLFQGKSKEVGSYSYSELLSPRLRSCTGTVRGIAHPRAGDVHSIYI